MDHTQYAANEAEHKPGKHLRQHHIIRQGDTAIDFASQKIRCNPQTQLCGAALSSISAITD